MHTDIKPGQVYWNQIGIFKTVKSLKSGSLYAKQLDPKTGSWSYASGAIHKLQPQTRVTLAQAQKFGLTTGRCLICGRTLSNTKSVAAGIGPECAKGL